MGKTYPFPTPLPVIPGAFKVRIFGTVGALPSGVDLCFRAAGTTTPPTAANLAAAVANHWPAVANSLLATEYTGVSVGVYDLSTAFAPLVEIPMNAPGGAIGAPLPIASCALIKHSVGVRRKSGKTFLSPIVVIDTDTANNNLAPLSRGRFQSIWGAFVAAMSTDPVWGGGTGQLCVLSLITHKAYVPQALPVLSSVAETKLASQNRRRLR